MCAHKKERGEGGEGGEGASQRAIGGEGTKVDCRLCAPLSPPLPGRMVWMLRGGSRSLPLRAASEFLAGAGATDASGRAACLYFKDGIECVTLAGSAPEAVTSASVMVGISMTGSLAPVAGRRYSVMASNSLQTSVKDGRSDAWPDQQRSISEANSGHWAKQSSERGAGVRSVRRKPRCCELFTFRGRVEGLTGNLRSLAVEHCVLDGREEGDVAEEILPRHQLPQDDTVGIDVDLFVIFLLSHKFGRQPHGVVDGLRAC